MWKSKTTEERERVNEDAVIMELEQAYGRYRRAKWAERTRLERLEKAVERNDIYDARYGR